MELSQSEKVARIFWTIRFVGLEFKESAFYRPGMGHLGAVLADAILQSGISYQTVVEPRIQRITEKYPHATNIEVLHAIVEKSEVDRFLMWNGKAKIRRFEELIRLLRQHRLNEISDVREWLKCERNSMSLLGVPGVGPKTIDYMKVKLGIPSIPVDRHLFRLARYCGVIFKSYEEASAVFARVSKRLNVDPNTFDITLWTFMKSI
jgi:endonuclease III